MNHLRYFCLWGVTAEGRERPPGSTASPSPALDATITGAVLTATLWPSLTWASGGWWGVMSALGASVPLLWRRRAPLPVAIVVGAATTGLALAQAMPPLPYGALVCTYTVAALSPLRWQLPAAFCWATSLAVSFVVPGEPLDSFGYVGMAFATAYALGLGTRARRAEITALEERTRRLEEERTAAAARERTRIVRDMHDILTHSVGIMVVQAEAGSLMIRTQPDRAEAAFDAIGRTGREAIGQLRHIFGVLRATGTESAEPLLSGVPHATGTESVEPLPGLYAVERLVERVRQAGLEAAVESHGELRAVPAEVGVTVYRLIQESLTNTLRHAGATEARVRLSWSPDSLRIEVTDNGRGPQPTGGKGGHGLIGMRERVTACGGTVWTGPGRRGGFTVTATLPIRPPSGEDAPGAAPLQPGEVNR
ncbi:sensor histidine kinase [Streptosporangium sp. NPDC087985]|uniref:sensor histidine kinase n=1 Tax=Streptosporangium sp. NPDC087985 TaxID=3366196 RepID=UPI00380BD7C2